MKKLVVFILLFIGILDYTYSQDETHALMFSQFYNNGTVRYNSVAGSMGALGGDFSSISSNPAGLGVYRKSEFSFTPSFYNNTSSSIFYNSKTSDSRYTINIPQVGIVGAIDISSKEENKEWKFINFAMGYNRYNNFYENIYLDGFNSKSSMIQDFANKANGYDVDNLDPFYSYLAYSTWLIDPDPDTNSTNNQYIGKIPANGVQQSKSINKRGGIGETVFAIAGNYNNKVYIGGSIGIVNLRYIEESEYKEVNDNDTACDMQDFILYENLKTKGNGVNAKLGIIYKPYQWVRLGLSFHTPTFYSLSDEYSTSISSQVNEVVYDTSSAIGNYSYNITTPMKIISSIGFVIGKYGFISGEYELINYSDARIRSNDYLYTTENRAINNSFGTTNVYKVGGEINIKPFAIRGGYAFYDSPYVNATNKIGQRTSISGGFGIREESYYIDFGYIYSNYKYNHYVYSPDLVNEALIERSSGMFNITVGFKF